MGFIFWVSRGQPKRKPKGDSFQSLLKTANKLGDDLDFSGKWKMWSYKEGGSRSLENVRHPWCCEKRIALQDSKDLFWIRTGILPYLYSPMCRTFCTFQQTCQTNWTFNILNENILYIIYINILFRERGNIKRVANMEKKHHPFLQINHHPHPSACGASAFSTWLAVPESLAWDNSASQSKSLILKRNFVQNTLQSSDLMVN